MKKKKKKLTKTEIKSIKRVSINKVLAEDFLAYSVSNIERSLPNVIDGLKPVHRRILFAMLQMKTGQNYKSARVVGEVLGKYHPHGDTAVYQALVGLAQDFNNNASLVKPQGNFGGIDGSGAAAMRYTEVCLDSFMYDALGDELDIVPTRHNFDDTMHEPLYLPFKVPVAIINGTSGVATGYSCTIQPHNLEEVCMLMEAIIKNQSITPIKANKILKGPDYPTGGIIEDNRNSIYNSIDSGRSKSFILRSRHCYEESSYGRVNIIAKDIPYQKKIDNILLSLAKDVRSKKVFEFSDIRDESNRKGVRIVFEVKRGGNKKLALNYLLNKGKQIASNFYSNITLYNNESREPVTMGLLDYTKSFVNFRREIKTEYAKVSIKKLSRELWLYEGVIKVLYDHKNSIEIIVSSNTEEEIFKKFNKKYGLERERVRFILSLPIRSLVNKSDKVIAKANSIKKEIEMYNDMVINVDKYILKEVRKIKKDHGIKRKTKIIIN